MRFLDSFFDSKDNYLLVSRITPFAIFILMVFGGYVKALGAGLACPDFPLCHGQLIPFYFESQPPLWVFMEFAHRFIALSVSITLIVVVMFSYVHRHGDKKGLSRLFLMLMITSLLFVQILLGGLTVLTLLNELVVTTHLAVAVTIFGLTIIHFFWIANAKDHSIDNS